MMMNRDAKGAQGMSLEDFFALMQAQSPAAATIPNTNEQEETENEEI